MAFPTNLHALKQSFLLAAVLQRVPITNNPELFGLSAHALQRHERIDRSSAPCHGTTPTPSVEGSGVLAEC